MVFIEDEDDDDDKRKDGLLWDQLLVLILFQNRLTKGEPKIYVRVPDSV